MNISDSLRRKCMFFYGGSLSILGYYRGIQHYEYNHKIDIKKYHEKMIRYNNDIKRYNKDIISYPNIDFSKPEAPPKPNKFFLSNIGYGISGSIIYLCPIVNIVYIPKEFYQVEIYLRNLKDEKTKRYYNTLDMFHY